ncbi:hypothetical protein ACC754_42455, partial [Rhizobium johnstonii]
MANPRLLHVYRCRTGNDTRNGGRETASVECKLARDRVASLTPLMKGQVAAMVAAYEPRKLTAVSFNGPDGKPLTLDHF